ncbi:MAG: hypothetical protein A2Z49_08395 [Chloroflexi bacterium RBG_19FT_COMBO_56_12]|nr:MAG: hypothetical protein A2Z49_08395 [Chloroflexi bacterium RBG_19FT_COMBO_56_12]
MKILLETPIIINKMAVYSITDHENKSWDTFVSRSAGGLPTHLVAWREILTRTYGYHCHFLVSSLDGKILGVLPLFQVDSLITGKSLQSLPGAICAEDEIAAQSLIAAADSLARDLKVDYLLLRDSRQKWSGNDLEVVEAHRGVRMNLPTDVETAWKSLRKDVRYHIRHGQKSGMVHVSLDSRIDDLYSVLLNFNQYMGTPLFGFQFLKNVLTNLPNECLVINACVGQKPVAGYFNFTFDRKIFGMWGGTLTGYQDLKVTHQVYWALIEHAIRLGFAQIDMGRSSYPSSQYDFKSQWGDENYPIYQLLRVYRGKMPQTIRTGPDNETSATFLFKRVWRKSPTWLVRKLGPYIRRHIPFG